MNLTYAEKKTTDSKVLDAKASSLLDSSSQSESLQRKADMANNATQRAEAPRPNNTGMPDNLKAGIESLSGFSMDDVHVHYNSSKPATVQALAYTQGTDIHVAPGQEKHLPHEAWHVAQQMAGRVSPTTNINGMPVNDNAGLEHEADVMGEKAVQCKGKRRKIEKKNPLNIVQYFTLDDKEFNTFGELREWIKGSFFCPNALKESFNMEETLCDDFDISNLETIDAIINILPSKKDDIDKLKTQFDLNTKEEQYEIYKKYFAKISLIKQNVDVDADIKDNFFTQDNINTIIAKYFSPFTGANIKSALQFINKYKLNEDDFFNNITIAVKETLSDINFWKKELGNIMELGNINIENIFLTDSDVHTRGVGVCILKFNNKQEYVIKPEDKSLEKAIYGKDDSLATSFDMDIGTLDIRTTEKQGSCIEYFNHNRLPPEKNKNFCEEKNTKTSSIKVKKLIYFASLLGLRDLHKENLVYSNNEFATPQLIDAEVAMWFVDKDSDNPFHHALNCGETKMPRSIAKNHEKEALDEAEKISSEDVDKYIKFLKEAKNRLSGKKSRVVLIETGLLYKYRGCAYSEENYIDGYISLLEQKLSGRLNEEIHIKPNKQEIKNITDMTFLKGQIPFFEYIFDTGEIYQKNPSGPDLLLYKDDRLTLNNVIDERLYRLQKYKLRDQKEIEMQCLTYPTTM